MSISFSAPDFIGRRELSDQLSFDTSTTADRPEAGEL